MTKGLLTILILLCSVLSSCNHSEMFRHAANKDYYLHDKSNTRAEDSFRIGFIQIADPIVIKFVRNEGSQSLSNRKRWYANFFVTSAQNIPERVNEEMLSSIPDIYVLINLNYYYNLDVMFAQYPPSKFDWSKISTMKEILGEYGQNYECCELEKVMDVDGHIQLLKFKTPPYCFALALINTQYFNSRSIWTDGPSQFIPTKGLVQTYVKAVSPVCCLLDSTNIPKLLPWVSEYTVGTVKHPQ